MNQQSVEKPSPLSVSQLPRLPWSDCAGSSAGINFAQQPLSPQMIAFVISLLATFICLLMLLASVLDNVRGRQLEFSGAKYPIIFGACTLASITVSLIFLRWHRLSRCRADVHVDVLGKLFPLASVLDIGRAHLTVIGLQVGSAFRIVVLAQNVYDKPTQVNAYFEAAAAPSPLELLLPDAGVIMAIRDLPLTQISTPVPMSFSLTAQARGDGGKRIRFGNRMELLSSDRRVLATVGLALGGHVSLSLAHAPLPMAVALADAHGKLCALVGPSFSSTAIHAQNWIIESLWQPSNERTLEQIDLRLREVLVGL